jgi:hypothetical protein
MGIAETGFQNYFWPGRVRLHRCVIDLIADAALKGLSNERELPLFHDEIGTLPTRWSYSLRVIKDALDTG